MTQLLATAVAGLAVAACGGGDPPCDRCAPDGGGGPTLPTALAIGGRGQLAALALEDPWRVRATGDLGAPVASVRVHADRFYAVLPAPANRVSVVAEVDLAVFPTIDLAADADPRDIAFVDDTAIISQHGLPALARVDLRTGAISSIDLSPLADPTEGVAAGDLAVCGSRVFVQLQRGTTPGIGVVDITPTGATIVQTIPTAGPPAFAMPVDCGSTLYVAEPIPLMQGGGSRERIDLATLTAAPFPIGDGLGEVGGFVMTGADTGWFIAHTEFGPSPSSHLSLLPAHGGVWDTFAEVHIDHLAYDAATNQVLFPDACTTDCGPSHGTGLKMFAADTGAAKSGVVDVGFPPIDVVVAR